MAERIKNTLKKIPIVGKLLVEVSRRINALDKGEFDNTIDYWEKRYASGGNSGSGSYNHLASFKADVINKLIGDEKISSAIEFGCGDGNQLRMISYPKYIGFDVSATTIRACAEKFSHDTTKSFYLYSPLAFWDHHQLFQCDLSLSLDVIYHIVEEAIYQKYMDDLFHAGRRFVVVYSSNYDSYQNKHVKHHAFSKYVEKKFPQYKLQQHIRNPFQYSDKDEENTSLADFYIYKKDH